MHRSCHWLSLCTRSCVVLVATVGLTNGLSGIIVLLHQHYRRVLRRPCRGVWRGSPHRPFLHRPCRQSLHHSGYQELASFVCSGLCVAIQASSSPHLILSINPHCQRHGKSEKACDVADVKIVILASKGVSEDEGNGRKGRYGPCESLLVEMGPADEAVIRSQRPTTLCITITSEILRRPRHQSLHRPHRCCRPYR